MRGHRHGGSGYRLEDRGNRYGLFVNGAKVQQQSLRDGDVITFGVDDSYQIVFHVGICSRCARRSREVANLLTRIGTLSDLAGSGNSRRTEQAQSAA